MHEPSKDTCSESQASARSSSENAASVIDRVEALRQQLAGLVTLGDETQERISWGCSEFDAWMPGAALQPGMMVELLYSQRGVGAGSLAIHGAQQVVQQLQSPLVVVDRSRLFYPPAAVARGIDPYNLIMIRPPAKSSNSRGKGHTNRHAGMSSAEELWALDQALRCSGVAVVMAWMENIEPNAYRRLQLAAEAGKTLAILIRPERVRALPTWADVQVLVSPSTTSPALSSPTQPAISKTQATEQASIHTTLLVRESSPPSWLKSSAKPGSQCNTQSPPRVNGDENRRCRVTLLRQRGRSGSQTIEGSQLELEINERQGTLRVSAGNVRNEARAMHMAPRVAYPANRRRSTGA